MADYKQLCAELLSELENAIGVIYAGQRHWCISSADAVITKADAALAEPEPEVPTNEELCDLMYEFIIGTGHGERLDEIGFARAVLARWGRPAPEPADGEVAELVAWLRSLEDASVWFESGSPEALKLTRAADLLEQRQGGAEEPSVAAPVPVSEPWPEFSDCDDTKRVWCWSWAIGTWRLSHINQSIHSHWLPAHALPVPNHD